MPKDIVSGDFYWLHDSDGLLMIAAVDCTGHGVPGAFMSIVGFNQLNHTVNVRKVRRAADILDSLNEGVISTLNENKSEGSIKDGMDMSLCLIDFKSYRAEFAGANNPLMLIRDGKQKKYKGDRFPIGAFEGNNPPRFRNHEIDLKQGDCIYLFSDGYEDQFGGPDDKKFMSKRFEELLSEIASMPMAEQKKILIERLNSWMGTNEQVDDILVIGIKI
jgi:serine phosphatase RsbU (regulator of sigma subunit)